MKKVPEENLYGRKPHQFHSIFGIKADSSYTYVPKKRLARRISRRWCALVHFLMPAVMNIFCGFEVCGLENLQDLHGGAVSVCNHVHTLDCAALESAFWGRDTYFFCERDNFGIPVVRRLIKRLKALPVPEDPGGYSVMLSQLSPEIDRGSIFQVYPEGSLRTDCRVLRSFKPGAFRFAVGLGVPVLPCVIKIERNGRRIKRTLIIGEPVYADNALPEKERIRALQADCRAAMLSML